jgi:predicted glutamine amidotransferase
MCGIAGISLSPNDTKLNVRTASVALLRGIASRGPDATGAAWYDHDQDAVKLTKIAVNTEKFIAARKDVLPETTPVIILHTRFATTGDKAKRENNHPIHHGNIVGVHNGVLWDHKGMFEDMGRKPLADVDSEAIFALLNDGVRPEKVLNQVAGDAAIGWIDMTDPDVLHLARVVDRPLFIAQTTEGSLLYASTKYAIQDAAKQAGVKLEYEHEVEEGKYLKVVGGVIAEYLDIPGVKRNAAWSNRYAWTSGGTAAKASTLDDDWDWTDSTRVYSKSAPARQNKAKTAPKDGPKVDKPEWFTTKANHELIRIANSGSPKAKAELKARGYSEEGTYQHKLTDDDLVTMCKAKGGHPWAAKQLAARALRPDGSPMVPAKAAAGAVKVVG